MVGIHDRSAREKIGVNSSAHIMQDEATRKMLNGKAGQTRTRPLSTRTLPLGGCYCLPGVERLLETARGCAPARTVSAWPATRRSALTGGGEGCRLCHSMGPRLGWGAMGLFALAVLFGLSRSKWAIKDMFSRFA